MSAAAENCQTQMPAAMSYLRFVIVGNARQSQLVVAKKSTIQENCPNHPSSLVHLIALHLLVFHSFWQLQIDLALIPLHPAPRRTAGCIVMA